MEQDGDKDGDHENGDSSTCFLSFSCASRTCGALISITANFNGNLSPTDEGNEVSKGPILADTRVERWTRRLHHTLTCGVQTLDSRCSFP